MCSLPPARALFDPAQGPRSRESIAGVSGPGLAVALRVSVSQWTAPSEGDHCLHRKHNRSAYWRRAHTGGPLTHGSEHPPLGRGSSSPSTHTSPHWLWFSPLPLIPSSRRLWFSPLSNTPIGSGSPHCHAFQDRANAVAPSRTHIPSEPHIAARLMEFFTGCGLQPLLGTRLPWRHGRWRFG
jgi:hypothetical protein